MCRSPGKPVQHQEGALSRSAGIEASGGLGQGAPARPCSPPRQRAQFLSGTNAAI